jgi:hypothetical protein
MKFGNMQKEYFRFCTLPLKPFERVYGPENSSNCTYAMIIHNSILILFILSHIPNFKFFLPTFHASMLSDQQREFLILRNIILIF